MAPRVLVADDEPAITDVMAQALGSAGYDVIEAHDGAAALERARREHPDAMLIDVMMPGLDGREVCRRIRDDPALADTPIALFSSMDERDVGWRAAGADAFLQKAFDIFDLPDFVARLLDRGDDGRQPSPPAS
ncbi:MAG: response regulator [Gemmatimonadota bacterium]